MSREVLYGWGRTTPSVAELAHPKNEDEVLAALMSATSVIARGLGRSYGDAAQLSGGLVLDNRAMRSIGQIDPDGVVTLGAGVSIDELLAVCVPQGWFVPVTPGTRQVTIAGAVAADVHGKNHHADGSFANHVLGMRLITPTGAFNVSRTERPELFWATMGAMGLTGVLSEVTIRLLAIETDRVLVDTERVDDLDAVMSAMSSGDEGYRYSVAWVDCMTRGAHMGRAILTRAEHAARAEHDRATLEAPSKARLGVPLEAPSGLLNPLTIKVFNELWFRSAPRRRAGEPQSLSSFFHPLDGVRDWNRLYGRRGFVQYQFCVPERSASTIPRVIERLATSRVPSFLAVLKRFGASNPAPLSFPIPGWTLALDLPVGPSALPEVLDDLDDLVLEGGGRIYLAKDARLNPTKVRAMYPELERFLAIKRVVDPEQRLVSDLARRLHLIGT